jgi:DNA-binding NtrC family response regulator
MPPFPLVGVGPPQQFALAETIDRPRMKWLGVFEDLGTVAMACAHPAVIVLLDGDAVPAPLIELLDQHAAFLSRNAVILLIAKPAVRVAVTAMQRGVLDVLIKPLTVVRLDAALKDALAECDRRHR